MKEGDFGGRVFYWGAEEEVLGGQLEEGADWCADDVVLLADDSNYLELDYIFQGRYHLCRRRSNGGRFRKSEAFPCQNHPLQMNSMQDTLLQSSQ